MHFATVTIGGTTRVAPTLERYSTRFGRTQRCVAVTHLTEHTFTRLHDGHRLRIVEVSHVRGTSIYTYRPRVRTTELRAGAVTL